MRTFEVARDGVEQKVDEGEEARRTRKNALHQFTSQRLKFILEPATSFLLTVI